MTDLFIVTLVYLGCMVALLLVGVPYIARQFANLLEKMDGVYSAAAERQSVHSQRSLEAMSGLIQELADRLLLKSGVDPHPQQDTTWTPPVQLPADGFAAMRARGLDPDNPLHVEQWEEAMGGEG